MTSPIRQLRQRLQVTTRELADLLGCDIRQVQRWERSDQRPPISAVRLLHLAATVPEARAELERLAALHEAAE